jgi:hypothetical protein
VLGTRSTSTADALTQFDRIVHSSHKIELKGKSLRDHKQDK